MNRLGKVTICILLQFFLSTKLYSQQYFVDETLTRLPQITDHAREGTMGDLDSDGDLDFVIVCSDLSDNGAYFVKNSGAGYFAEDSLVSLLYLRNLTSIDLGDIERDSDLDLLLTEHGEEEHLFINDGNAIFTDETSTRLPDVLYPTSTKGSLIDADGEFSLDISISNTSWNHNFLWLNSGNGVYTIASEQFPSGNENSNHLIWGDVEGDFDLDCVIANGTDYPNRLMINDGSGWFTDETEERLPADLGQSNGIAFVDLDGDGDLDIIVANGWLPGNEKIYINDGHGIFTDESSSRIPQDGGSSNNVTYGDIENDGDFDLIISNSSSSGVDNKLYVNNGAGYFSDETIDRFPILEEETADIVLGDIDVDGDLDCLIVNFGDFYQGQQNRMLVNISTIDTIPPIIAKTLIHEDVYDSTCKYIIASSVWDNISITIGEVDVILAYNINGGAFKERSMYDCGGYIYRREIPNQSSGSSIDYYIKAIDRMGNISLDPPNAPDSVYSFLVTTTGIDDNIPQTEVPKIFSLSQNYPNPFNPSTVIKYTVPKDQREHVSLCIYNLHGKIVKSLVDSPQSPGIHHVHWDGKDRHGIAAASGIYFYRIAVGDYRSTRKMTLIR